MKIAIFGSGYVGLVTAACFAQTGHQVICIDVDNEKIHQLNQGIIPIFEPQLSEMILSHLSQHKITFTTDAKNVLQTAELIFIAVGTPANPDGSADLRAIFNVTETISHCANHDAVVVIKSTVPIGTTDEVQKKLKNKVVFNPEFLKQGDAVHDCLHPDRIIIGCDDQNAIKLMRALYRSYFTDEKKFLVMDTRSAEMTKYVANAMLATKISFINEMSQIADRVGADIYAIRDGIALDVRIGPHFINPGLGYGGSCFPKDIKALQKTAENVGYHPRILHSIEAVNTDQKLFLFDKIMRFYKNNIRGKVFAIWGLSFKPNTDDIRDASSIILIEKLWEQGALVRAYDPQAMHHVKKLFGENEKYTLCDSADIALENANALCIVTEWEVFRSADLSHLSSVLIDQVIFDGRQVLNKNKCESLGLTCIQV